MVYIIRYAEIAIKGKNRPLFEKRLVKNIKSAARFYGKSLTNVKRIYGRVLAYGEDLECLQTVFGVSSISRADELPLDLEIMKREALARVPTPKPASFKIQTQRLDKSFAHKSPKVNELVGEHVHETLHIPCKFKNPELTIYLEIFNKHAYIFTEKIQGFGGLPVGVEGVAQLNVETAADALAGILMMKRGTRLRLTGGANYLDLLNGFGHVSSETETIYTITGENLKSITHYAPTTFYPLIAHGEEQIKNELKHYQNVFNSVWHQN
jgi:thiamine biosynthesis protein ThiI